jgi:hypothetical protein
MQPVSTLPAPTNAFLHFTQRNLGQLSMLD